MQSIRSYLFTTYGFVSDPDLKDNYIYRMKTSD